MQDGILILDVALVKFLFHSEQRFLGRLQQHVDTAEHHHRHDDLLIFTFLEGINQYICRYVPDEREQLVILTLIHSLHESIRSERTICSDDNGLYEGTSGHEKAQIGAYRCPEVLGKPIHTI